MPASQTKSNGSQNRMRATDRAVHDWFRFVLSYPPHLVRNCLERFGADENSLALDPFCGTGTTLVECKKLGIASAGIEANPFACYATEAKIDWRPSPGGLRRHAATVAEAALAALSRDDLAGEEFFSVTSRRPKRLRTLPEEQAKLLLNGSISPVPLHKTLVLLEALEEFRAAEYEKHERLALASALVDSIGNLHFGPEVGVGPPKDDAPVVSVWRERAERIASDLKEFGDRRDVPSRVFHADSRDVDRVLAPQSVDVVITSPPYPNEKDYTRTTRLESVLLGFIRTKKELRALKKGLIRSNTRNVYIRDDDDRLVANHPQIQRIAAAIESRRIAQGKTSGFERMYHRVVTLYFGGMTRHLANLRTVLRPGARLAYVVGDQASYLRVMIRTGALLADIAASLGYEVVGIDLFRTRLATATREQLREEVVLLKWPGKGKR
ncbi:MAG: DNA methyltransferase [Candidatus Sumerlaeota bacterium]|nr:DNA methyltransferase [Candidatus Sumerlaeota bacterium]